MENIDNIIAKLIAEPSNNNYICARHFAADWPKVRKADIAALVKSAFDSLQPADYVTEAEYRDGIKTMIQIFEVKQADGSYALTSHIVKGDRFGKYPANCYRYIAIDISTYAIATGIDGLALDVAGEIREWTTAAFASFKGNDIGCARTHYLSGAKIAAAA